MEKQDEPGRTRRTGRKVADAAERLDQNARLVTVAKMLREFLPGDSEFGDSLSTGGKAQPQVVGRRSVGGHRRAPGRAARGRAQRAAGLAGDVARRRAAAAAT